MNNIVSASATVVEDYDRMVRVIMFIGFPGSGKSTLARMLKYILNKHISKVYGNNQNNNVVFLEQDMFGSGKGASKQYDKAITNSLKNPTTKILILAKSNHSKDVRDKTYAIFDEITASIKVNIKCVYVMIGVDSADSIKNSRNICIDRIMNRGFSHTTLFGLPREKITHIIDNIFIKQFTPLTVNEKSNRNVIMINIELDKQYALMNLICQLNEQHLFINDPGVNIDQVDISNAIESVQLDDLVLFEANSKKE
jgi:tRNA splicing ligase